MPVTGRLETTAARPVLWRFDGGAVGTVPPGGAGCCPRPSRRRHDALSAEGSHAKTSPCSKPQAECPLDTSPLLQG